MSNDRNRAGYEAVVQKLVEIYGKMKRIQARQAKDAQKLKEFTAQASQLTETLKLLGVAAADLPEAPAQAPVTSGTKTPSARRFGRTRVIDAIQEIVQPGQTMTVAEIVQVLQTREDVQLHRQSPGSTVSVALRRAMTTGGEFEQVRKGTYRRRERSPEPESGPKSDPPPAQPNSHARGGHTGSDQTIQPAM